MSGGDSSPNSSELALVSGGSCLVDVDASFSQIVIGCFGVFNSLDSEKGLVRSLGFSISSVSGESGFYPESGGGSSMFL